MGVIVAIVSCCALAQVSPEEAKAKLAEKDQQRQAERAQLIQITSGELTDLRAKVARLEGEVRALQGKLGQKETFKKAPETIEIGMTKEDVVAFVKAHPALQVISVSASAGVNRSSQQTIVRRRTSDASQRTENDGPAQRATAKGDNESKVEVDTVHVAGKQERMVIARYGSHSEQSGSQRNALGGSTPTFRTVEREEGRISVTLVDGVVTEVNAN
jgi:hypothetical protein